MLEIKNLHASAEGKDILKGINLSVPAGEVHAIMGPNGSGKSSLSHVIAGHPRYQVTDGSITLNDADILAMPPTDRAVAGVFLAFQSPPEIPGAKYGDLIGTASQALREKRGQKPYQPAEFIRKRDKWFARLGIAEGAFSRAVNVGFSGGERKRMEVLQIALLDPTLVIMDEIDSGLDIDSLKIVADGVNMLRTSERSFLIITHYQRLLNYIVPDAVHVLADGRIEKTGGMNLVRRLEREGYTSGAQAQRNVIS